jgi:hypothetical protein
MSPAGRTVDPAALEQTQPGGGPGDARRPKAALLALAVLSLCVYTGVMTLFQMSNNDIWIHLKTGEYVLTNGWVPQTDPYSFIAADRDYVAHEWLAGVLFYLVYSTGGVVGLIFFKAAVLAISCFILYRAARLLNSRLAVILPAYACLLYISTARYLERPHIFSYLMGALYLWLFFKYREHGRNRGWLYVIPVAHAVWTNLHGGYVQGLAMVLTFALGELLIWARARHLGIGEEKAIPGRDVVLLWLLAPACIVASLVNPYGYRLLLFPFHLTGMEIFMQSIYEWQPPYHFSYNHSTMFFFYLILVVWLSVAFFLAQRDRRRARGGGEALAVPNIFLIVAVALVILLIIALCFLQDRPGDATGRDEQSLHIRNLLFTVFAVFALFTLVNLRSVDFTHAGIFLLFFLMSLRHNRAVTDAAMGTFVILTASMSAALDGLRRRPVKRPTRATRRAAAKAQAGEERPAPQPAIWRDRSSPRAVLVGSFLLLGISLHASFDVYYFDFTGAHREKGFGIASNMPVCAVDFVERKQITGNAFVSYPFAAMLIHRMHPDVKVNMDSRNDVYGEELYQEYWDALRSPDKMEAYLARHPIDFFMLSYGDRVPRVFQGLEATGDWVPVYYDNRAFILVRNTPEHRDLINREAFRILRPGVIGSTVVSGESGVQLLEESERAIKNCPTATVGHFYKSKALQYLGRYEEALVATGEILEMDAENYQAYAEMGHIYARMNRPDKAVEMYEEALRIRPDYKPAHQQLRQIRGF